MVIGLPEGNILIDTPPELRLQCVREGLGIVNAVAYTHEHADHLFGLDDLRIFASYLGHDLPIFCEEPVERRIRTAFSYAFETAKQQYAGGTPKLVFCRLQDRPFTVLGATVTPIPLGHGRHRVLGYRIGRVAYCTDTNYISPESMERLRDLDILILDGLRHRPHPTHFTLEQAVEIAQRLKPQKTYFTHICHDLGHDVTNALLPPGMELAYDGMKLELSA